MPAGHARSAQARGGQCRPYRHCLRPAPEPHANLIDRYLIAAEHAGIAPLLLLNKADLIDEHNEVALNRLTDVYRQLDYPLLEVSAHGGAGMDELKARTDGHVSVFVGQSGVGKSSLVNSLLPGVDTRVGALSEMTGKGTHTTTTARLFHFPGGGELIDSPGIREFGLGHVSRADVEAGFIEFRSCSATVASAIASMIANRAAHCSRRWKTAASSRNAWPATGTSSAACRNRTTDKRADQRAPGSLNFSTPSSKMFSRSRSCCGCNGSLSAGAPPPPPLAGG